MRLEAICASLGSPMMLMPLIILALVLSALGAAGQSPGIASYQLLSSNLSAIRGSCGIDVLCIDIRTYYPSRWHMRL